MSANTVIKSYITFEDGEARIVGKTHLKAEIVARMHANGGASIDEVKAHYDLTRAEVHAALSYYYENREVLDAAYEEAFNDSRVVKSSDMRAKIEARRDQQG